MHLFLLLVKKVSNINKLTNRILPMPLRYHKLYIYNKQLCYKMASDSNNSDTNKKKVSKKGILLTALIVAGIIGTSFIVYFIP
jgi:hypothetical protein